MLNIGDIIIYKNENKFVEFNQANTGEIVEILKIKQSINREKINKTLYKIRPFREEIGYSEVLEDNVLKAYSKCYDKEEIKKWEKLNRELDVMEEYQKYR